MLERNSDKSSKKRDHKGAQAKEATTGNETALAATYPMQPSTYAITHDVPLNEVWNMIRAGELLAHNDGNQLLIYDSPESLPKPERRAVVGAQKDAGTTPLPTLPSDEDESHFPVSLSQAQQSTEVALLIDHLSLAKEENKEIIRLAHESMSQTVKMTESILNAKDILLDAKASEIERLEAKLAVQEMRFKKLQQEKEDLEMLTKMSDV